MPTESFKVVTELPIAKVADLLCCAFEGGSNYWYEIVDYGRPVCFEFRTSPERIYNHIDYPLNEGGWLLIADLENPAWQPKVLGLAEIKRGLQVMADKFSLHYADALNEDGDAVTGDVFLQCCIFGDVIYG
jgi:hypothetical protein